MSEIIYRRDPKFEPDFNCILKVLKGEIPSRPTLFEFALNDRIIGELCGIQDKNYPDRVAQFVKTIHAFANAGYDYATISGWRTNTLSFPKGEIAQQETRSLNQGFIITDRESFEKYSWPDPNIGDYEIYSDLEKELPAGMKLIASGNGGLLENVIDLVGFENLSLMTLLDEELTKEIFDMVGARFLRFYEIVASINSVGACIVNDDWGFKNQTMFSPEMLRRWVFPWHKKMVNAIHKARKPAILHSCGQLKAVMNDIIIDMDYDGKHSFEDQITPVEEAYKEWGEEIAILGGIDMDYLARRSTVEIIERSKKMLKMQMTGGNYALGSGNSIADYIPDENYIAMISTVNMI